MKILNIAYYTIIRNLRDRKSMSLTLLLPVMLIFILGSALSKVYSPGNINKVRAAYINEDRGELSKQFDQFLGIRDIKNILDIKKVNSYQEGIRLVNANKATALIYIEKDYSAKSMSGNRSDIKVIENNSDALNTSIIKNVIESFTNGANTVEALEKMGPSLKEYRQANLIKDMPISKNGNVPKAIDYYAVTMMAMTLMYGTLYASFGMAEDKRVNAYIRIKSAPLKNYENYIGKTLGAIATLLIQVLIIIAFTKFVYHVNWGNNMAMVLFLCTLFSIFATGLGIFAYAITNNSMRASAVLNILTVFLTFISGGYAKIVDSGSIFDKIVFFSPNKMFQTAMFNTIYHGPTGETQTCIIGMIAITIVMYVAASTFGRRAFN